MTALSTLYEYLCLLAVFGWLLSRLAGRLLPGGAAEAAGLAAAGVLLALQWAVPQVALLAAIFAPVSGGVALFAAADLGRGFGLRHRPRPAAELLTVLAAYLLYLAAGLGVFAVDPHAAGYGGVPAAATAVALGGYALVRRDTLLAAAVLLAQLVWLADIGSENLFDNLAGVLLVPALLVGLWRRARGR